MPTMTKEEYERWWSAPDGSPPEGWHAVPCECGREDCPGWRMKGPGEQDFEEQFSRLMEPR